MKRFLGILLFLPFVTFGQWTTNPGEPLRACPTNSNQYAPWIFTDGISGQYIFWTDDRGGGGNGDLKLFVQHLDQNGNRLFPDSGKLLVHHPTLKTDRYAISRDDQGRFLIAWGLTSNRIDSIVLQKFDNGTLNPIWPGTKTIARTNAANFNILGLTSMRILPVADSVTFLYLVTWMGGSTVKFVNRMSANGTIRFGNGKTFNGYNQNYGPSTALINPDGTTLLIQRNGNGSGTGVTAWKFDKNLNLNWGPKSLTAGTPGLGYSFEVIADGQNGFVMAYITPIGTDLMATRVDSAGNFVWTPNHRPICDYSSNQDSPDLHRVGNYIYCAWKDNRPPANNTDIYMQKLDLMGNRLWNPNGRRVIRLNSYIPVPRILPDADGNIIVASHQSSTGFVAQKVMPDSSLAWPGYGLLICSGNTLTPDYELFGLSPGANGNTFVAWQGFQTSRIYVAGFANNGTLLTPTNEPHTRADEVKLYPNPSTSSIEIEGIDPQQKSEIVIFDLVGKAVFSQWLSPGQTRIQIQPNLPKGHYRVQVGGKSLALIRE